MNKYTRRQKKLMSWVHMKGKQAEHRAREVWSERVMAVLESNGGLYGQVGEPFDYRLIRASGLPISSGQTESQTA